MVVFLNSGCYSLKGISIAPEVKTFYVEEFGNKALNAVPAMEQTFTEALKEKIRRETRLTYTETDPDIVFSGNVVGFDIIAEAPKAGENVVQNKLTIKITIDYTNEKKEKENWKQTFSYFYKFDSDQNLFDIQDQAIDEIYESIIDDTFNKAFNNW